MAVTIPQRGDYCTGHGGGMAGALYGVDRRDITEAGCRFVRTRIAIRIHRTHDATLVVHDLCTTAIHAARSAIDGRAVEPQRMRRRRTTVILEFSKQGIRVDKIAGATQEAGIAAVNVIPGRMNITSAVGAVAAGFGIGQDCTAQRHRCFVVEQVATSTSRTVLVESDKGGRCAGAIVQATTIIRRAVMADGAVNHGKRTTKLMNTRTRHSLVMVDGATGNGHAAIVENPSTGGCHVVGKAAVAHSCHSADALIEEAAAIARPYCSRSK